MHMQCKSTPVRWSSPQQKSVRPCCACQSDMPHPHYSNHLLFNLATANRFDESADQVKKLLDRDRKEVQEFGDIGGSFKAEFDEGNEEPTPSSSTTPPPAAASTSKPAAAAPAAGVSAAAAATSTWRSITFLACWGFHMLFSTPATHTQSLHLQPNQHHHLVHPLQRVPLVQRQQRALSGPPANR